MTKKNFVNEFQMALQSNDKELAFDKVCSLAQEIFAGASEDKLFKRPCRFDSKELQLQEFIYDWTFFLYLDIPKSEYKPIYEEGLKLLETLLKSDIKNYQTLPGYKEFKAKARGRYDEIIAKNPNYQTRLRDPSSL